MPDARLADQDGVVLRPPREHLDHAPDLLVAADDRVELARLGERGEVAAVLLERLVRALGILRRHLLPAAHVLQRLEQRVARDDVEREQEVLDGDVLVARARISSNARSSTRLSAAEACGCAAPPDTVGWLRSARLRLGAQLGGAVARALASVRGSSWSSSATRQVVGRELRVARPARELLRAPRPLPALESSAC